MKALFRMYSLICMSSWFGNLGTSLKPDLKTLYCRKGICSRENHLRVASSYICTLDFGPFGGWHYFSVHKVIQHKGHFVLGNSQRVFFFFLFHLPLIGSSFLAVSCGEKVWGSGLFYFIGTQKFRALAISEGSSLFVSPPFEDRWLCFLCCCFMTESPNTTKGNQIP